MLWKKKMGRDKRRRRGKDRKGVIMKERKEMEKEGGAQSPAVLNT